MARQFRCVSLLVVGILVMATAIAIYREYRIAIEDGTMAPVHEINAACLIYAKTYPQLGFPHELSQLGLDPRKPLGPDNSGIIDAVLASGEKSGYLYKYQPGPQDESGKTTTYSVTAVPRKYTKGTRSYASDQTGVIRFTDANRKPTVNDPELTF